MSEIYLPKRLNLNSQSIITLLVFYTLFAICAYTILDGAFKLISVTEPSIVFFFAGVAAGMLMTHCYKQI